VIILGIDPGPAICGWAEYDTAARVVLCAAHVTVEEALDLLRARLGALVAIERVQSQGQSGASLLQTSEVVGRLQQRALISGLPVDLIYRREVLRALDVTGRGERDSMVRQRLLEMHPGGKGTKKAPGPLYGVSGHCWQALAVAVAAGLRQ